MNVELKAMLALVFDGISIGEQAVAKVNFFNLLPAVFQIVAVDLPPVISNWSDLMNEIKALPGTAQEADLISYIETRFAGVAPAKAQAILAAVLQALQAVYAVVQAIQA